MVRMVRLVRGQSLASQSARHILEDALRYSENCLKLQDGRRLLGLSLLEGWKPAACRHRRRSLLGFPLGEGAATAHERH